MPKKKPKIRSDKQKKKVLLRGNKRSTVSSMPGPGRIAPAFSPVWRKKFKEASIYIRKIKNLSVPVEDFADDLLEWMRKPKCSYEPYAALVKMSLGIRYHRRRGGSETWSKIVPRLEKLTEIADDRGSNFAIIIMHESMGHRYLDLWLETGDDEYEKKVKMSYLAAYDAAVAGKFGKNIDSSIFWLAAAYERAGRYKEARKYYCKVAAAGSHFSQGLHMRKIRAAKERCKCKDIAQLKPVMKVV